MHWVDYVVVALYLLATAALGFYLARRVRSSRDFFLAGRRLPFWAIGMSLVVSDIGALEMVGGTENAFLFGAAQANYEWIGCVPAMIVGALIFVPVYWRSGVYSIPEYLGQRYGAAVQAIQGLVWALFLGVALGIFFHASAAMFSATLGWDRWTCVLLTAGVTALYTVGAGLSAVVFTDVVQCVVLFAGGLVLVIAGLRAVGGLSGLQAGLEASGKADHLRLLLPLASPADPGAGGDFPWGGILLGLGLVLSPAYWLGNQAIVQRVLGARDEWSARAGMLFGALLKTFVPLAFVLPGLVAVVYLQGRPDVAASQVYSTMIAELLPAGLRGLLYAAFLAALMSSVDSYTNSAATIVSRDLYGRFLAPGRDDRHYLRVGRAISLVMILLGVAMVPVVAGTTIYTAFQTALSIFQGATLALIAGGLLWGGATQAGGLAALLAGIVSSCLLLFALGVGFLYASFWSFLVAVATLVLVSRCTGAPGRAGLLELISPRRGGRS